jgi:DNA-binding PadR family transcriptional regulator
MATKVEVAVLGLLAEAPMHGYDLLEGFRERGMGLWTELSRASVYQVLKRLERTGAVVGKAQEGREGPDRRVFRITKRGREHLAAGVAQLASEPAPFDTPGAVALGFSHVVPVAVTRAAVDAREGAVRELLEAVRSELGRTVAERDAGRAISIAMLRRQEALADAELAWLGTFRSSIGKIRR